MPAPAVIPAPRAYINAVAVKGFVVELWAIKELCELSPTSLEWGRRPFALGVREQSETKTTGTKGCQKPILPTKLRMSCMCTGGRP